MDQRIDRRWTLERLAHSYQVYLRWEKRKIDFFPAQDCYVGNTMLFSCLGYHLTIKLWYASRQERFNNATLVFSHLASLEISHSLVLPEHDYFWNMITRLPWSLVTLVAWKEISLTSDRKLHQIWPKIILGRPCSLYTFLT